MRITDILCHKKRIRKSISKFTFGQVSWLKYQNDQWFTNLDSSIMYFGKIRVNWKSDIISYIVCYWPNTNEIEN